MHPRTKTHTRTQAHTSLLSSLSLTRALTGGGWFSMQPCGREWRWQRGLWGRCRRARRPCDAIGPQSGSTAQTRPPDSGGSRTGRKWEDTTPVVSGHWVISALNTIRCKQLSSISLGLYLVCDFRASFQKCKSFLKTKLCFIDTLFELNNQSQQSIIVGHHEALNNRIL